MTHKYQEGDQVALLEDLTDYLPAGSLGVIFCLYTTAPPAYEVNFAATTGQLVGNVFYEDEIEAAAESRLLVQREAVGANS